MSGVQAPAVLIFSQNELREQIHVSAGLVSVPQQSTYPVRHSKTKVAYGSPPVESLDVAVVEFECFVTLLDRLVVVLQEVGQNG